MQSKDNMKIIVSITAHWSKRTIIEDDTCGRESGVGGMGWIWIDPSRGNFEKI